MRVCVTSHFSIAHVVKRRNSWETLHGHNYKAVLCVEKELDELGMVMDFKDLKLVLNGIIKKLDHKTLLPSKNKEINLRLEGNLASFQIRNKKYTLPLEDVELIPTTNVTAEEVALYLVSKLREKIQASKLELSIYESPDMFVVERV